MQGKTESPDLLADCVFFTLLVQRIFYYDYCSKVRSTLDQETEQAKSMADCANLPVKAPVEMCPFQ